MELVIGLGNPGEKYAKTRHNVGYTVVDRMLNAKWPMANKVKIFKSENFMNESGEFVKKLIEQYGVNSSELWIIHDDLDIPLGRYKIQKGVGPKVHNGINSIEETLGTSDFWRVRVGVDNRNPEDRTPGEQYVLQDFTKEELIIVNRVSEKIIDDLVNWIKSDKSEKPE